MFGGVCFMVNGHMAMGTSRDRLMVRLDPDEAEQLLGRAHVSPMDFTGKPMRGFLFVEAEGVAKDQSLRDWVDRCVAFAESRPEKTRAKATSKRTPRVGTAAKSERKTSRQRR